MAVGEKRILKSQGYLFDDALEFRYGLRGGVEDKVLVLGDQADEDREEDLF